jgi:hypothetical protein
MMRHARCVPSVTERHPVVLPWVRQASRIYVLREEGIVPLCAYIWLCVGAAALSIMSETSQEDTPGTLRRRPRFFRLPLPDDLQSTLSSASPLVTALSMLFAAVLPPMPSTAGRTVGRCVGSFAATLQQLRPVDRADEVPAAAVEEIAAQHPKITTVTGGYHRRSDLPEAISSTSYVQALRDNFRPLRRTAPHRTAAPHRRVASRAPYQAALGNADLVLSQCDHTNALLWGLALQTGPRSTSALSPLTVLFILRVSPVPMYPLRPAPRDLLEEALFAVAATTPVASLTATTGDASAVLPRVSHPTPALLLTHVVGRWIMRHVHDVDVQGDLTQTAIQLICQRGVNVAPSTFLHAHDTSVDSLRGLVSSGLPVASALTQCPQLVRLLTSGATSDSAGDAATVRRCVDNIIRVLEYLCAIYDGAGTPPVFLQRRGKEWPLLAAAGAWTPIADATVPWILARARRSREAAPTPDGPPEAPLVHPDGLENDVGYHRMTPLAAACTKGSARAVEALLRYGADGALPTDSGTTALMCAAQRHHVHIVDLLLEFGARVNQYGSDGTTTALTMACHGKSHEFVATASSRRRATVELLLRHGANPLGVKDLIEDVVAEETMPLVALAQHDDVETLDVLLPAWEQAAGWPRSILRREVMIAETAGFALSECAIGILELAAAVARCAGHSAMASRIDSVMQRRSRKPLT